MSVTARKIELEKEWKKKKGDRKERGMEDFHVMEDEKPSIITFKPIVVPSAREGTNL